MGLVENMKELAEDIITSFENRKKNLAQIREEVKQLRESVKELLAMFEKQRLEMSAELRAKLRAFVLELESKVRQLLEQFEQEREEFRKELFEAQQIWIELEKTMERLRMEDP